ncbi:MAG: glycosyltransferase family 39 protein [Prolixibacteraceae bacterium]|nr:glycosyltransferase family 39 protein [Prolixibacteraceae bacterium]
MKNLEKKHYIIIGVWLLINLLQAIFTGLHSDESYYWMYSQNLDWGYFDHPPMVAFFIYLGQALLLGELGVRLLIVLFSTVTFTLILNELNERKDFFFVTLFMLSFPLIHTHISGFLAIPDNPLLFFVLLFLILYKRFIEKPGYTNSILLGIVVAAMIYSKYHAFLVIGFTVLSNLKLFKNKFFYLTIIVSILLLIPHALWQFNNEFPTFKYHLIERAKPFQFKYIIPYLSGILLVAGPLSGILVFWKLQKLRIQNQFQRTLIFNIIGFILTFFILSFKNRIEIHWLAAIIPMLMFLSYPLIKHDEKTKKWFVRLASPVIILLLVFRVYLAMDVIPNIGSLKITFYNRESNAFQIKELAQGKTVGFFNNYAAISNYMFYTGDSAVYLSTYDYRFCQYDLWDYESFAKGDNILAIQSKHMNPPNLTLMTTGEMKGYINIVDFQPLKELNLELIDFEENINDFEIYIALTNNSSFPFLTNHSSKPVLAIEQNKNLIYSVNLCELENSQPIHPGEKLTAKITIPVTTSIKTPLIIYVNSENDNKGDLIAFKPESWLN